MIGAGAMWHQPLSSKWHGLTTVIISRKIINNFIITGYDFS